MSAVMDNILNKPAEPLAESPPKKAEVKSKKMPTAAEGKKLPLKPYLLAALPPILGIVLLVLVWQIVAVKSSGFPSPAVTLQEAINVFSDPFYQKGPNDQGIGWNLLSSLKRVGMGFGLAA